MRLCIKVLLLAVLPGIAMAGGKYSLVMVDSSHSVAETTSRLTDILNAKGMTIFATIDHQENAEKVGMSLPATTLILFGNPKLGSQLMSCQQSIGIDLPMKFLVRDDNEHVTITYNSPTFLKRRHSVKGCDAAFEKMTGALAAIAAKAAGA